MPIDGLPTSNQREAAGGSNSALSTAFNKLFTRKNDNPIDMEPKGMFKNVLIEMISTDSLGEVNQKTERKPNEEEFLYMRELNRLAESRTGAIVKKKKDRAKERQEEKKQEEAEEAARAGGTGEAAEYTSSSQRVAAAEETLVKDYVVLTAKHIVQRPKDQMDNVRIGLARVKDELTKIGLTPDDFSYLDQKALDMIKDSFFHLIKDKFFSSANSPLDLTAWIVGSKDIMSITDFLSAIEKDYLTVSERARILESIDVVELMRIAAGMHLDLDSWMALLGNDKLDMEKAKGSDVFFRVNDLPAVFKVSSLVNEFRAAQTHYYLEDNMFRRLGQTMQLSRIRSRMAQVGVKKHTFEEISVQSRRIAWLKTITNLKQVHLNRILATTANDFNLDSRHIEKLTKRANRLGFDIPKEGLEWIQRGLRDLAMETAKYKLELMKSLQQLSFDKNRNKDIARLTNTITLLARRA